MEKKNSALTYAEIYGQADSFAAINATMPAIQETLDTVFRKEGPFLCEIFVDPVQVFEPKSATKRLPDGSLFSPPLEDLAPFLPREELKRNMFIPLVEEPE